MKRLIKVCSLFLFLTSCYLNKNIYEKNEIYFEKIENFSSQPSLTFILNEKIREIFLKYPKYTITNLKEKADYNIELKILEFERIPLFYSKLDPDEISGAKYEIKLRVNINDKDKKIVEKEIVEHISFSIYKEYREEEILNRISEHVAKRVYFEILKISKK